MTVALVVAAGSGRRLDAGMPKALVQLQGRTLLQWSVDALRSVPQIGEVIVALPEGVSAPEGTAGVRGGLTRSESVRQALRASSPAGEQDVVLVHDAARPLLGARLIERVIAAAAAVGVDAAIAAAPVSDTIKRAERSGPSAAGADGAQAREPDAAKQDGRGGEQGEALPRVTQTLRRSGLWAVQTPQGFKRGALLEALDQPVEVLRAATDDASLVEGLGGTVVVVPSSAQNIKITTPFDLRLASLLLRERKPD